VSMPGQQGDQRAENFDAPFAVCGLQLVVAQSDFPTLTNQLTSPHVHLLPMTTPPTTLSVAFPMIALLPPTTPHLVLHRFRKTSKIIALKGLSTALRLYPSLCRVVPVIPSRIQPQHNSPRRRQFCDAQTMELASPHQGVWWNTTDDGKL
jgi:hypothetical protein